MQTLLSTARSSLVVWENFTPDFYHELRDLPLEVEPAIFLMGRECHQRRDVGFFSDESIGYSYSGQIARSVPLSDHPLLADVLARTNAALETRFNGVLVNRYVTGEKYIGAHSDDERSLSNSAVASVAYGPGVRTFRVRNKATKAIVLDYPHAPCALLVMRGDFQKEFTHEIPVQKRVKGERISLTFRSHHQ